MLIGRGAFTRSGCAMRSQLALTGPLRAHLMVRDGLRFDSRFVVALSRPSHKATILLHAAGTIRVGDREHGDSVWALREDEMECPARERATYASYGDPAIVLELCLPAAWVRGPLGLEAGPRPVTHDAIAEVRAMVDAEHGLARGLPRVLDLLVREGVLVERAKRAVEAEEQAPIPRVWDVLASVYRKHDTSAYVQLFASIASMSPRQIHRDLRIFMNAFGFGGFRPTLRALRLRRAALLLSCPALSVTDVAFEVGYNSTDALARAFRDIGWPTPSDVRAALRGD